MSRWNDKYLEDAVLEAYNRGVRDTIVAIGQSLRDLLQQRPPDDLEAVLRDTHGLLAQDGEELAQAAER